jgi:hypothetical protein
MYNSTREEAIERRKRHGPDDDFIPFNNIAYMRTLFAKAAGREPDDLVTSQVEENHNAAAEQKTLAHSDI